MGWLRYMTLCTTILSATLSYAADKPGPFASSDEKLDYLLETWNGRSLETLGTVWGKETTSRPRGLNQTYVYERSSHSSA